MVQFKRILATALLVYGFNQIGYQFLSPIYGIVYHRNIIDTTIETKISSDDPIAYLDAAYIEVAQIPSIREYTCQDYNATAYDIALKLMDDSEMRSRLRLVNGDIKSGNEKGGHVWIEYYDGEWNSYDELITEDEVIDRSGSSIPGTFIMLPDISFNDFDPTRNGLIQRSLHGFQDYPEQIRKNIKNHPEYLFLALICLGTAFWLYRQT